MSPDMVKLPEGVTVHAQGQKYTGEIPAELCPKKYRDAGKGGGDAPKTPKDEKPKTDAKPVV